MSVAEIQEQLLPLGPQDDADHILAGVLAQCRSRIDTREDELDDALAAGPWELRSVELSGFRGAANGTGRPGADENPFRLEIPRSARVVVLQGANGTGKSTIADALDVALVGGTGPSTAFAPSALEQPVTRYEGTQRSDVVAILENDHGDRLRLSWGMDGASEDAEVVWQPADSSDGVTARPGEAWAQAISSQHSVVGYDHWTHRLRIGHLTEFVHDRLRLGTSWWDLWSLLQREHRVSADALTVWNKAREETVTALEQADEQLTLQHPYATAPPQVDVPASPSADVKEWFDRTFPSAATTTKLPVAFDPRITSAVLAARDDARAALAGYQQLKKQPDGSLSGSEFKVLQDLVEHLASTNPGHCPACGESRPDWVEHARLTLQNSRRIREEFNLTHARFSELRSLLLDDLLPVLKHTEERSAVTPAEQRIRSSVEPLVDLYPRSDCDEGWSAIMKIVESETFAADLAEALGALSSATDVSEIWQTARRDCCKRLLDTHRSSGPLAARSSATEVALERLGAAFDEIHRARREVVADRTAEPLRDLLGDAGVEGLRLDVSASDRQGLNEATDLRLSLHGAETAPGSLSAGQYNALVLALLLSSTGRGPLRFLVLDDPVHAMDDFRTNRFAELIASRVATGQQIVLLTHDQQLVDVLRHHVDNLNVVKLSRDEHGNIVQLQATHPWQPLLDDAKKILSSNRNARGGISVLSEDTTAVLVLSFCRQAIDAVLREFVVDVAPSGPRSSAPLEALDRAFTTRNALTAAQQAVDRDHPAHAVIGHVLADRAFLNDLNAGSHGDPAATITTPAHLIARVGATERFCTELRRASTS
jgi:energy-coupling factor transporter ATP-binding protein EcfA2